MQPIEIVAGEIIKLKFLLSDGNYSTRSYTTKIQEILENNSYLISPPFKDFDEKYEGKYIKVFVTRKDSIYSARAVFIKFRGGALPLVEIHITHGFIRMQRRDFFRIKANLNISVENYGTFKTLNISGNGIAFISDVHFEDYQKIKGSIDLEGTTVKFNGIVIRTEKDKPEDANEIVCISFTNISMHAQDTIVKFICKKQLSQIRMEPD